MFSFFRHVSASERSDNNNQGTLDTHGAIDSVILAIASHQAARLSHSSVIPTRRDTLVARAMTSSGRKLLINNIHTPGGRSETSVIVSNVAKGREGRGIIIIPVLQKVDSIGDDRLDRE